LSNGIIIIIHTWLNNSNSLSGAALFRNQPKAWVHRKWHFLDVVFEKWLLPRICHFPECQSTESRSWRFSNIIQYTL